VEKVWRMNRFSQKVLLLVEIWMVLVWQIKDDSPNSPNFLPAKLSYYTVYGNVTALSRLSKVTTIAFLCKTIREDMTS